MNEDLYHIYACVKHRPLVPVQLWPPCDRYSIGCHRRFRPQIATARTWSQAAGRGCPLTDFRTRRIPRCITAAISQVQIRGPLPPLS